MVPNYQEEEEKGEANQGERRRRKGEEVGMDRKEGMLDYNFKRDAEEQPVFGWTSRPDAHRSWLRVIDVSFRCTAKCRPCFFSEGARPAWQT